MKTKVTRRGQTVVPAALRARYGIQEGDQLEWIDDGEVIKVVRVSTDPIGDLRGEARGEDLPAPQESADDE